MSCKICPLASIVLKYVQDLEDKNNMLSELVRSIDEDIVMAPICPHCGKRYEIVRPGKYQPVCDCQSDGDLERG